MKKIFLYLYNLFFYLLSLIIKKDKNMWVFGAWMGKNYSDNSRFLFEYIQINHPEIKAIWVTDNDKVLSFLKNHNYEVYKKYSFKATLFALKAGVSIFTHSNLSDCIPFLSNRKTKLVQLWHGIPLKKIGYDDRKYSYKEDKILKRKIKNMLFPFLNEDYDLIIACSDEDKSHFITAFNCNKIKITGYPRNEVFFNKNIGAKSSFRVVYFPTFRDNIGDEVDLFSNYRFDFEIWDRFLVENNIYLEIKMHPVNKPKKAILELLGKSKNISFLDDIDIASYLNETDILITDYSSVYFDYLLTDKPIIFTPFDKSEYIIKDRELYYNYDDVTPGPKCYCWNDVLDEILKFKKDCSYFSKERYAMKNRFHFYDNGSYSNNVYNEIIDLLKDRN